MISAIRSLSYVWMDFQLKKYLIVKKALEFKFHIEMEFINLKKYS
jgi:hypothetical protein